MNGAVRSSAAAIILASVLALAAWQYLSDTKAAPVAMREVSLPNPAQPAAAAAASGSQAPILLENGLGIQDMKIGSGEEARPGMRLSLHYTGMLEDGTVFDSSVARNDPFEFTLGAGEVIDGWDIGLQGIRVGGERKLMVPPALAYGDQAVGPIPADSTLYFEVVLLGIERQ